MAPYCREAEIYVLSIKFKYPMIWFKAARKIRVYVAG